MKFQKSTDAWQEATARCISEIVFHTGTFVRVRVEDLLGHFNTDLFGPRSIL